MYSLSPVTEHRAGRRAYALAAAAAAAVVVVRSLVWLLWEQSYFDSDQAINGLMAKHLAEGRTLPLFFYGQPYLLAVEAWITAPFFRAFGISVTTLKLPLVLVNVAIAVLLIRALVRDAGLDSWLALVASVFFVVAPPIAASRLLEASGANVEPLLYTLLLWMTRRRPVAFGLVAGVGILHREFTAYAVIALLALELSHGRLWTRDNLRIKAIAFAEIAGLYLLVRSVQPHADIFGPGSRGYVPADVPATQLATWSAKFCWNPSEAVANVAWLFRENLAALFGWRRGPLAEFMATRLTAGHAWALAALLVIAAATAVVFFSVAVRRPPQPEVSGAIGTAVPDAALPVFLMLTGAIALGVYCFGSCLVQDRTLVRYTLLGLFVPVGGVAWVMRRGGRALATVVASAAVVWASAAAWDTTRLLHEYVTDPPPSIYRGLADFLESRGVKYARAPYWTAYHIAFLTNERVVASSYERVRINQYQDIVSRHRDEAVFLYFDDFCKPTEDGVNVLRWCVGDISRVR